MSVYIEVAGSHIANGIRDGMNTLASAIHDYKNAQCNHKWDDPYVYTVKETGIQACIVQKCKNCGLVIKTSDL